jgi:hypothetical protein
VVAPSSPLGGHADQQSTREPRTKVLWAISGVGSHRSCRLQIGAATQVSHPLCLPHGAPQEVHGQPSIAMPHLPPIKHGQVLPQPEKILSTRLNHGVWKTLVQLMGQVAADATWEKVLEFKDACPSF